MLCHLPTSEKGQRVLDRIVRSINLSSSQVLDKTCGTVAEVIEHIAMSEELTIEEQEGQVCAPWRPWYTIGHCFPERQRELLDIV